MYGTLWKTSLLQTFKRKKWSPHTAGGNTYSSWCWGHERVDSAKKPTAVDKITLQLQAEAIDRNITANTDENYQDYECFAETSSKLEISQTFSSSTVVFDDFRSNEEFNWQKENQKKKKIKNVE